MSEQLLRAERWMGRRLFAESFLRADKKMLFILGHMRAGSSLLTHILCTHPDIVGYGETQNEYCAPSDFGATAAKVYRKTRSILDDEVYVLDKVLHERLIVRQTVLEHPAVRIVFILRRPEDALSSLLQSLDFIREPSQASDHYGAQLKWMRDVARCVDPERWTYTTYAQITQETATTFRRLERCLGLSTPLSERYETTRHTGKAGIGDSGPYIGAGRIKQDIERSMDERVRPYLDRARAEFQTCLQTLQEKRE